MGLEAMPGARCGVDEAPLYVVRLTNEGEEEVENGELVSDAIVRRLQQRAAPITDVILLTHGFGHTLDSGAVACRTWVQRMATCEGEVAALRVARGGAPFRPLVVALCWPSNPTAPPGWREVSSFLVDWTVGLPHRLADAVRPKLSWYMAFMRFEPRARRIGGRVGRQLLRRFKAAATTRMAAGGDGGGGGGDTRVRYHAFGHSLGVQLICSLLQPTDAEARAATSGGGAYDTAADTLDTLVLVQGAAHSSCFGVGGPFAAVPARVGGVLLVTYNVTDVVLVAYAQTFGAGAGLPMGTVGAHLPRGAGQWCEMGGEGVAYGWAPGLVNVDAGPHIRSRGAASTGDLLGAHSDFMSPAVMHAFWAAMRVA